MKFNNEIIPKPLPFILEKTNYKLIIRAVIPIVLLLILVLKSEFRTEGSFGGLVDGFKYLFFLICAVVILIYNLIKQGKRIYQKQEIKEAKIILVALFISTCIGISSIWFPKDYFEKEPVFIASDIYGTRLILSGEKYMLRTQEYEWINIDRGLYELKIDTLILTELKKEERRIKRIKKFLIVEDDLIPIYWNEIEKDTAEYLKIERNINKW